MSVYRGGRKMGSVEVGCSNAVSVSPIRKRRGVVAPLDDRMSKKCTNRYREKRTLREIKREPYRQRTSSAWSCTAKKSVSLCVVENVAGKSRSKKSKKSGINSHFNILTGRHDCNVGHCAIADDREVGCEGGRNFEQFGRDRREDECDAKTGTEIENSEGDGAAKPHFHFFFHQADDWPRGRVRHTRQDLAHRHLAASELDFRPTTTTTTITSAFKSVICPLRPVALLLPFFLLRLYPDLHPRYSFILPSAEITMDKIRISKVFPPPPIPSSAAHVNDLVMPFRSTKN